MRVGITNKALINLEGAEKWVHEMLEIARGNFEKDGELTPVAFFLMTRHPETKKDFPEPQIAIVAIGDGLAPGRKEQLSEFLHMFAERSNAIGYLMATEAWGVEGDAADKKFMREYREGDIEKRADRTEMIWCSFEHRGFEGTRTWRGMITRDAANKPTLSTFLELPRGGRVEGRFSGVLPRSGAALA
jgi:hypothetical protein